MEYTIDTLPSRLTLGRQTETGVNDIRIDMSEWLRQWPGLAISIWPTRPGEKAAYPADTYMDGSSIIWRVNSADTAIAGSGTAQIMGVADGQKKLSKIMTTYIANTTTGVTTGPPAAAQPWADGVAASAASAQQAAQRAEDAAGEIKGISAIAQTLKAGQAATAEYADGVLRFGIPAGERGEQGPKGDKGDTGEQGPQGEPGKDAVVDATLTQSGQAADAKSTGEALAGKLSEPVEGLAVGKYFRVAALDENGHAVLEAVDAKTVGVQDVQANGESIVADGVAAIPNTDVNKYGIVKLTYGDNSGTTYANDTIYIVPAFNNTIDNRKPENGYSSGPNNRHAIVPAHLDYAVKAAMCDGKGEAWTADEQTAARERLGMSQYTLIETITIEEDTQAIIRECEPDGTPYSFDAIMVLLRCNGVTPTASDQGWLRCNYLTSNYKYVNLYNMLSKDYNSGIGIAMFEKRVYGGWLSTLYNVDKGTNVSVATSHTIMPYYLQAFDDEAITSMYWYNARLLKGMIVEIYGARRIRA